MWTTYVDSSLFGVHMSCRWGASLPTPQWGPRGASVQIIHFGSPWRGPLPEETLSEQRDRALGMAGTSGDGGT